MASSSPPPPTAVARTRTHTTVQACFTFGFTLTRDLKIETGTSRCQLRERRILLPLTRRTSTMLSRLRPVQYALGEHFLRACTGSASFFADEVKMVLQRPQSSRLLPSLSDAWAWAVE